MKPVLQERGLRSATLSALLFLCANAGQAQDHQRVEIVRDRSGVPHVFAADDTALFYGVGYALAHDRLAEWEATKRMARGEMAEAMGAKYVDSDRLARIEDHTDREWESLVQAMSEPHRRQLLAYRAGVNAYIAEAAKDPEHLLPYEFKEWGIPAKPWSVAETAAAVTKGLVLFGSGGGGHELENLEFRKYLQAKYSPAQSDVIFDDVLPLADGDATPNVPSSGGRPEHLASGEIYPEPSANALQAYTRLAVAADLQLSVVGKLRGASRSVVVGPSRSASGRVLMLQSTADGPDVHLVGAGFDTAGWAVPGTPFPCMGRGPNHGFLVTTGESDIIDLFEEKLRPGHPEEYQIDGQWRKMDVRKEAIHVKGAADVNVTITRTVHGPVILSDPEHDLAYSQADAQWNHELDNVAAWIEMGHAHTFAEFETAVSHVVGSFNVQYGGEDGTIAHWHAGAEPLRANDVDPRLPTPGDGKHEWRGRLKFKDWPKLKNPQTGYFHVWNNKPSADTRYGDTTRYGTTFRTYLGNRLLAQNGHVSFDDMKEINRKLGESAGGADLSLTSPTFFTPYLRVAVKTDSRLTEAVERMGAWDGLYEPDSTQKFYSDVGLTIFRHWMEVAQHLVVEPVIGEWWHRIDDDRYVKYRTELLYRIIARTDVHTPVKYDWFMGRDRNEVLRATVATTVKDLEKTFGTPDMQKWRSPVFVKLYDGKAAEESHLPTFNHAMQEGTLAGRLGLLPAYVRDNGSEEWNGLMEIGPDTRSFWDATLTGGQDQFVDWAGHGNPHIADQVMPHVNFQFKHVPMTRDEINSEAEEHLTLEVPNSLY